MNDRGAEGREAQPKKKKKIRNAELRVDALTSSIIHHISFNTFAFDLSNYASDGTLLNPK